MIAKFNVEQGESDDDINEIQQLELQFSQFFLQHQKDLQSYENKTHDRGSTVTKLSMARKSNFRKGDNKNQDKQMVFYHRAKRIGNQFVQQRSLPEHYTTTSFDDAKKEKKADFHNIRNDHRILDGVNIGGNKVKQYGFYKTLWDFEKTTAAN